MSGRWHRRWRHARRWLAYSLAAFLVFWATLVSIASRALPLVARYPQEIAAWLSASSGQNVQIQSVDAVWTRRGPLLTLRGLQVGDAAAGLRIGEARLLVSIYAGLLPGQPLTELRLAGARVALERGPEGRWMVRGLAGDGSTAADPFDVLRGLGELQLLDAQMRVRMQGKDFKIARADLRMRVDGEEIRAGAMAWLDGSPPLTMVLRVASDGSRGRVYLGGKRLRLASWAALFAVTGIEVRDGEGDIGIWADLRERAIVAVRANIGIDDLALRGREPIALPVGVIEPRVGFERVQASVDWHGDGDARGWRLSVPHLRVRDAGSEHDLDGIQVSAAADALAVRAAHLDLRMAASLLALSDRLPMAQRSWLYGAAPHGSLRGLSFQRDAAHTLRVALQLEAAGWLPEAGRPGVEGLGGALLVDGESVLFVPDVRSFTFDWPAALYAPVHGRLRGAWVGWRALDGWHLSNDEFFLQAEEITLEGRVHLRLGGEQPPWLDLALRMGSAPLVAAKRFWLRNGMSANSVDWLNRALLSGRIERGEIISSGPLKGWPYREGQGRFDARLGLTDVGLAFDKGWPAAQELTGEARFSVGGFSIRGSARVEGVEVSEVDGGIADFREGLLQLHLSGRAPGEALLALVRASPLQRTFGDAIAGLSIGGETLLRMDMRLPLKPQLGGERAIDGTIDLRASPLADHRWDVAFARADGRIRFTATGLVADNLQVPVADSPASLSIAVGSFTADAGNAAEFALRGRMPVDVLIDHYRSLDWLRPWMQGRSDWSVAIAVPRAIDGKRGATQLQIESDLVGTSLTLPAPLRKEARQALPLVVRTTIPLDAGGLRLDLGGLLRLRARTGSDGRLAGTLAFGSGDPDMEPEDGLLVRGEVPVLDVIGWAGVAGNGIGGADGGGAAIRRVQLHAGQIDLLDHAFAETSVGVHRLDDGVRVVFDGREIRGEIDVPATVPMLHGRFQRLYWPSSRASASGSVYTDARAIPPLDFIIADMRFGESKLGRAVLKAYPTPEGMHVERLETRHPDQSLVARGDWTEVDGVSRSRFEIEFKGDDLGRMLDAMGYAGVIRGGKTHIALTGTWPGSPAAFDLRTLNGSIDLDVGSGRILELEPGAGRILGMVSITQIPRRLLLDFRDIFGDGLGFTSLRGHFRLLDGDASTDDLVVQAPAAEIRVRGRAGLRAQDYDQRVEVRPKAGSVFPALGALAAGPAGMAIGAVAQAVLQRPLKRAVRTLYHVTGSWAHPHVEVLERESDRPQPVSVPSVSAPAVSASKPEPEQD